MEFWGNINYKRELEWNLNSSESRLCAYYCNELDWVKSRIIDDEGDYYCIAINKLKKELPSIGQSKASFSRALNNLVTKHVFDKLLLDDDKTKVYYRFNPLYKLYWKKATLILASDLEDKKLVDVTELFKVFNNCNTNTQNKTDIAEIKQSIAEIKQSVAEDIQTVPIIETININNQDKQTEETNHHNNKDDDNSLLLLEFNKLQELYPYTINNNPESLALALGVYRKLTQTNRTDLHKAVIRFSKTTHVEKNTKNNTTNYIKSLHNFILKDYSKFIYKLPDKFEYTVEFEPKKNPNGAQNEDDNTPDVTIFRPNGAQNLTVLVNKFNKAKEFNRAENEAGIKELFTPQEYEVFLENMGGMSYLMDETSIYQAEMMTDYLEEESENVS